EAQPGVDTAIGEVDAVAVDVQPGLCLQVVDRVDPSVRVSLQESGRTVVVFADGQDRVPYSEPPACLDSGGVAHVRRDRLVHFTVGDAETDHVIWHEAVNRDVPTAWLAQWRIE